mgnify:FL=1
MWNRFIIWINVEYQADLAQLVERKALNLVVMSLSPMGGDDREHV